MPKKTLHTLVLFFFCTLCFSVAEVMANDNANDNELQISNAACKIQHASQKIAKSYIYKEMDIRYEIAFQQMQEGLVEFDKNIPILQQGIKGKKEEKTMKRIVSSYQQLKAILPQPYSKKNGKIAIDASEALFEDAEILAQAYLPKNRTVVERTLGDIQRQLRLLERINKYYIAHHAGLDDKNDFIHLKDSIAKFEAGLSTIAEHENHPEESQQNVRRIHKLWPIAKEFYLGIQTRAQPVTVLATTDKLAEKLVALEKHHQEEDFEHESH